MPHPLFVLLWAIVVLLAIFALVVWLLTVDARVSLLMRGVIFVLLLLFGVAFYLAAFGLDQFAAVGLSPASLTVFHQHLVIVRVLIAPLTVGAGLRVLFLPRRQSATSNI